MLTFFLLFLIGCTTASNITASTRPGERPVSDYHFSESGFNVDTLIDQLLAIDPETGAQVINNATLVHDTIPPNYRNQSSKTLYLGRRIPRRAGGPLAVIIPRNADETALLGITGLKGIPKQLTLTIIQLNNLLATLGITRTMFLMDSNLLLELAGCFAYCKESRACLAAAQECEPSSVNYIKCLEEAESLGGTDYEEEKPKSTSSYSSSNSYSASKGYSGDQESQYSPAASSQFGGYSPYQYPVFYPQYGYPFYPPQFQPYGYGQSPSAAFPPFYGYPAAQSYPSSGYSQSPANYDDKQSQSSSSAGNYPQSSSTSSYSTPKDLSPSKQKQVEKEVAVIAPSAKEYGSSPASAPYSPSPAPHASAATQYKRAVKFPVRMPQQTRRRFNDRAMH